LTEKKLYVYYPGSEELGPDKLCIKLIAEECGIARTSFNYYFSKKKDFCDELLFNILQMLSIQT
jgi:AcrR family transcriptional regulator